MTIEEVVKVCNKLNLIPGQVISLNYAKANKNYPLALPKPKYDELLARGLAERAKPTARFLALQEDILNDVDLTAKKIEVKDKYRDIIMGLNGILDVENTVNKDVEKRVRRFFEDDERLISFYFTWLHLFPTTAEDKNKGWDKLFGIKYEGVPLRKVIDSNLRNFKRIAYRKDVGIYIIATYLFIRSYIRDGKCYIPKITNFMKEQEDMYANTKEYLESLPDDQLINIFELNNQNQDAATQVVPGMAQG